MATTSISRRNKALKSLEPWEPLERGRSGYADVKYERPLENTVVHQTRIAQNLIRKVEQDDQREWEKNPIPSRPSQTIAQESETES